VLLSGVAISGTVKAPLQWSFLAYFWCLSLVEQAELVITVREDGGSSGERAKEFQKAMRREAEAAQTTEVVKG
jgi:hypothetical protein